jgi:signal transduction histidine kinase
MDQPLDTDALAFDPLAPDGLGTHPPVPTGSKNAIRLWRSAGLRLAIIYAALFSLSAFALVFFLWWETAALLDRQVDAAIRADAQGLSEQWVDGDLDGLVSTIRERLMENVDDDAIYLVIDPSGHRIAGNLERWPAGVVSPDAWYELTIDRAGVRSPARVRRFDLPGGDRLLVGRDVRTRVALRRLLTDAMFWAGLVLMVLGLAGALLMNGLFRSMLANVSATSAAIAAGDLTHRVRLTGRGDEFDRLAETINDMLDRIAWLMDGVREVSNAIAHDLRTPIARARARLEDAGTHARTEADLRAALERAQADLDGVTSVFQALLRIAEIEAGARRAAFGMVELVGLLSDIAELYGAVAEEHGLRLDLDLPARLDLQGDRELIQQAVANLLDNAVKFSPPGGQVRLSAVAIGPEIRITVADQGPGIPKEDRARAVQRFFRGEAARHTPGSGLGLALVLAVAQLHGGTLVLEDQAPGLRAILMLRNTLA